MDFLTAEILASLIAGAHSVCRLGWMAEECEMAAIERAVRTPPTDKHYAYSLGKWAAKDELRALNYTRRVGESLRKVPWPTDEEGNERDYGIEDERLTRLEAEDAISSWGSNFSKRQRLIIQVLANGGTKEEAAEELGVHPSRISQLLREVKQSDPGALVQR